MLKSHTYMFLKKYFLSIFLFLDFSSFSVCESIHRNSLFFENCFSHWCEMFHSFCFTRTILKTCVNCFTQTHWSESFQCFFTSFFITSFYYFFKNYITLSFTFNFSHSNFSNSQLPPYTLSKILDNHRDFENFELFSIRIYLCVRVWFSRVSPLEAIES